MTLASSVEGSWFPKLTLALVFSFTSLRLCRIPGNAFPPRFPAHSVSNGCQVLHSLGPIGWVNGTPIRNLTTPSDVAQKFLLPFAAGLATATNSWHNSFGHAWANVNLYPAFSHHVPTLHSGLARDMSRRPACFGV